MSAQSEFPLSGSARTLLGEDPAATLCAFLSGVGRSPAPHGWWTATAICLHLGLRPTEANRRTIRQAATDSQGSVISGPGCPGYLHREHCTVQERREAAARLKSQGREMLRRGIRLERQLLRESLGRP